MDQDLIEVPEIEVPEVDELGLGFDSHFQAEPTNHYFEG